MNYEFIIIGSGIGGLTLAGIFEKQRENYLILEKRAKFKKYGSGLSVMSNAINALKLVGMEEQIIAKGEVISKFHAKDNLGKPIFTTDFKKQESICGAPSVAISRQNLVNALMDNVDASRIKFGHDVKAIREENSIYTIVCENGTEFKTRYIVGADGINSLVRWHLNGSVAVKNGGYECLLGLADVKLDNWKPGTVAHYWGKGIRIGIVDVGFDKIYWWLTCNHKIYKGKDWLIHHCAGWNRQVSAIIEKTKPADVIEVEAKYLDKVKYWHNGSMVLLGDAAHAMLTSLGQGACQAIEDAVCLGIQIQKHREDVSIAFENYTNYRKKRTKKVADTSKQIAKVEQLQSDFSVNLRNAAFRILPNRFIEKVNLDILSYRLS
jgi:FAD-dependent urate hydroxylase